MRSAGKEARYGATVNLVHVADGAENDIESTLRFFLSSRSAFVHGQRLDVGTVLGFSGSSQGVDWDRPLAGRVVKLGVHDLPGSGTPDELRAWAGIDEGSIVAAAREAAGR